MHNLFEDDAAKKRQLFKLMPMPWRIEFAKTTRTLEDATYTYAQLTAFFALQEAIEKQQRGKKRPHGDVVSTGGRGRGRGRGYGGRGGRGYGRGRGGGRGYSNYGSRPSYGHGQGYQQRAVNPFVAGAQGGRIPQTPRAPYTPRPYQTPRPQVPRVSNSASPRRPFVRGGRGPAPQLPQFMADEHYHQEPAHAQDQYYEDPGQEMYYGADGQGCDVAGYQDQYYGGDEQYYGGDDQGYDQVPDDQYYQDDQGAAQEQETEDHFLQDFSY